MRIAMLCYGMTGYQDACYRALAELGNDMLLVYPGEMDGLPFERAGFGDYAQRHVWQSDGGIWEGDPPPPEVMVPLVRDFAPDVVFMMSWRGKGYRAVMQDQRGRAVRILYTENVWHASPKQWLGRLTHRLYVDPLYDCAFVPSDRAEWFARRLGFTPDRVMRGALSGDVDLFERGARSGDELAGRRRFLFSGRLVDHKRPDVLAAAYREYRQVVADPWDLVVAGEGPLAHVFDGIPGVIARGFVQPADLSGEMHQASAFILQSEIDFFGVVVHEAATAGLPLIVSEGVGAAPALLQDGCNGWTVAPGNVASLTDAMVRMSSVGPERLEAMSDGSRSLARRLSPQIYATNFHEEVERRQRALGIATRAAAAAATGVTSGGRTSRRPAVGAVSPGR
jgi:glycosyltransferase involved in cell wall biosynthesis